MSEVPQQPAWPGQQPQTPSPAATPEPEPVRPSWHTVEAAVRRTVDVKLVIPLLIGLVSVTGAVLAWQSALDGEKATDKDRQAVAEAATVSEIRATNLIIVEDARARFAEHVAATVAAERLEERAAALEAAGDATGAQSFAGRAAEERAAARQALDGGPIPFFIEGYVTPGSDGELPTFDDNQMTDDLLANALAQAQIDPVQTRRDAREFRNASQRLDGWLIAMVGAIVVLTLAQLARPRPVRIGLAGTGTAIWIVSSIVAFGGR